MFTFLLIPVIHELGHYIAALLCGEILKFKFSFGRLFWISVPRWTWDMPETFGSKRRKFVAQSGFILEFVCALFLNQVYLIAACAHFAAYPWYAGKDSDFNYLV